MHTSLDISRRSWHLAVSLLALFVAPGLRAQPLAPVASSATALRRITFDDAVTLALHQNNTLRQVESSSLSSAAAVKSKQSAFLPSVALSTSTSQTVGRSFNQSEGAVLTQTAQSANVALASSVTLFDGLRNVNELRQAKLNQVASTSEVFRAKQTTVFTVASNFLTLVTSQAQLGVQRENLRAQEAQQAQLEKLVAAGSRPSSDLYQQQATTASARSSEVEAQRALELARIALIETLQLDPRETYDFVPPSIPDVTLTARHFALDSLLAKAFTSRSDLDAGATRVAAAQQGTNAASSSRLPTVSLSAAYSTAFNSTTSLSLADQLDQRRGGSVGIGISFPLFDRGTTDVAIQQARIQEDNARLSLESQRQTIALEVRRAYLDYETTRQQLAAALAQQKAADLAVYTTQQRYQVGSSTLLELTQARASQVQAATAVVNARSTLAFEQALMSYYTGDMDPSRRLFTE